MSGTSLTVAALMVALLEDAGISRLHGLPGEENLAVNEALRSSSIDVIVARHEQHAAFSAATVAAASARGRS